MENGIKGKVVAITGASSGIGKATAFALAKSGAKVILGARNETQLQIIVRDIVGDGGEAISAAIDVREKADLETLVELAIKNYGKLDAIVNNAGVTQINRIDELDIEGWEDMIDINIKGVLYGMAAAIPIFKQQQSGHIINIISTSGIKIVPTQGVYAGTKNAIRTITETFRQESDGSIRITGISPGYVKTNLINNVKNEEIRAAGAKNIEKLGISPEAIANAVIYALSQPTDVEVGDIVIRPAAQN
jgi:NADP-dependent 3-hydroxy acid dehydrogenase YdfG